MFGVIIIDRLLPKVLHRFCVCGFLLVVFLCLFFVSFISQRTLFFLLA